MNTDPAFGATIRLARSPAGFPALAGEVPSVGS